ncbi:putative SAD/SRA domain containing protein [Lyophyllum shimeji]|uniref:SAD/SRA domain containing protein n=1 Tax=Lyophyllum shimeji TaxID=47721 RepID=A0A9P3PHH2_LYOSH|nr:putative SAD/SRA domain containing protein [Lyophyllum shimeji]
MVSEYEKLRALNVQKNTELLKSLGLDKPLFEPKEKPHKAKTIVKKRKATADVEEAAPEVAKTPRLESAPRNASVRRSARNAGKKVDYTAEQQSSVPLALAYTSGVKSLENDADLLREEKTVRTHDPKTFGAIPGIEVGSWWETRQACSKDAVHAPWVAGISGGPDGAYSVALSGGYDDDVDLGYAFTYTGSGGRDLKGTKDSPKNLRTAPQSSDQSFENPFNKALKRSSETGNPVRVIRGFKLKSPYAPSEGYRYDGLYTVEKAWMEKGLNKKAYLVCKYAFKRIPGQPPLPVRDDTEGKETVKEALPDTAAAS